VRRAWGSAPSGRCRPRLRLSYCQPCLHLDGWRPSIWSASTTAGYRVKTGHTLTPVHTIGKLRIHGRNFEDLRRPSRLHVKSTPIFIGGHRYTPSVVTSSRSASSAPQVEALKQLRWSRRFHAGACTDLLLGRALKELTASAFPGALLLDLCGHGRQRRSPIRRGGRRERTTVPQ